VRFGIAPDGERIAFMSDRDGRFEVWVMNRTDPSRAKSRPPATTVMFTDTSLAGVVIKAAHITELRTAVNAMRAAAGLSSTAFTDGSRPGVIIKRVHIAELRSSLDEARTTACGPRSSVLG
jgi:hypothetical protein